MENLMDEYNRCLFHASSALHRWLGRVANEQFRTVELSPTEGFSLITLKQAPGIIISDLAHVHQLDPSTYTKVIDSLARQGYLRRERFGRSYRLFSTGKGERKEGDAMAAWRKTQHDYETMVGKAEATMLSLAIRDVLPQIRPEE
jgi:MarR family transcriptional regulator, organic hydroperoxide resistance regulator